MKQRKALIQIVYDMAKGNDAAAKLGVALRAYRIACDKTQVELAEELGVSGAYVCDIERGNRSAGYKVIDRLATLLEIKP